MLINEPVQQRVIQCRFNSFDMISEKGFVMIDNCIFTPYNYLP